MAHGGPMNILSKTFLNQIVFKIVWYQFITNTLSVAAFYSFLQTLDAGDGVT